MYETCLDTKGKFFLVATCVIDTTKEEYLEKLLGDIEVRSNKKYRKWTDCSNSARIKFLEYFSKSKFPVSSLSFSYYQDTLEYANLISLTIAKSILKKIPDDLDYSVKIFFDRINKQTENKIKIELRKLKIKYKKVRGMKDESFSLIRLTDSIAGFLRDYTEGKIYTKKFSKLFKKINSI